ncbi:peroxiredoxin family protein [Halobacteriales archaeon Cl-PHB]
MDTTSPPAFELRNAGVGPDPLSLSDVAAAVDFAVLLLLRDYHCPKCRAQVQQVADAAADLNRRNVAVVPVLPDSYEKAADWQAEYDLPFPLLADPEAVVGSDYDQTRRFGVLGQLHDVIGRMPKAVVLDLRDDPSIVHVHEGTTPGDRPRIAELLAVVDDLQESFRFDCELVEC